ncbi:unnamed protein product [Calicophoron daubneyi]|uniref:Protein kinase domain-containing protein n=1 Tax=Calicophoron daubneyi TaxID=300641 RepID=A0AAV2TTH7_CALDB
MTDFAEHRAEFNDPFEEQYPKDPFGNSDKYEVIRRAVSNAKCPVFKVYDRDLKEEFAIKVFSKRRVIEHGWRSIEQTNEEARILRKLNHPLIVNFINSWQHRRRLYLAMEYLPGGELFDLWKILNSFSTSLIRFFTAQIALALDYLRSQWVVYRDLKMENMLFDSEGYLKLIDFGASKELKKHPLARTYTICGTLAYAAPEMLSGGGYDYAVDWWALGVFCYAIAYGNYPIHPVEDYREMRILIDKKIYRMPDGVPRDLAQVIEQLLNKNPRRRAVGVETLNNLDFFHGKIDFEAVERKKYDARAFFTKDDIFKLPNSHLRQWVLSASPDMRPSRGSFPQMTSERRYRTSSRVLLRQPNMLSSCDIGYGSPNRSRNPLQESTIRDSVFRFTRQASATNLYSSPVIGSPHLSRSIDPVMPSVMAPYRRLSHMVDGSTSTTRPSDYVIRPNEDREERRYKKLPNGWSENQGAREDDDVRTAEVQPPKVVIVWDKNDPNLRRKSRLAAQQNI